MPIQLNEENSGKVLAIHVSGKLVKADYGHFVPEFERRVRQHGKLRVLDKKWQHGMATFFKPFTKATTQYFDHADDAEARKWLAEA